MSSALYPIWHAAFVRFATPAEESPPSHSLVVSRVTTIRQPSSTEVTPQKTSEDLETASRPEVHSRTFCAATSPCLRTCVLSARPTPPASAFATSTTTRHLAPGISASLNATSNGPWTPHPANSISFSLANAPCASSKLVRRIDKRWHSQKR